MVWIRSQDKNCLYKFVGFYIRYFKTGVFYIFGETIKGEEFSIGEYSTEEKALKVMDMLQKYIGGKTKYYITKDIGNPDGYHVLDDMNIPMWYCKNGIFEMPADEEV